MIPVIPLAHGVSAPLTEVPWPGLVDHRVKCKLTSRLVPAACPDIRAIVPSTGSQKALRVTFSIVFAAEVAHHIPHDGVVDTWADGHHGHRDGGPGHTGRFDDVVLDAQVGQDVSRQ